MPVRPDIVDAAAFGQRLTDSRLAREWSQNVLAAVADVAQSQVARWENGRELPTLNNLVRLSVALEVTTDSLLFGPAVTPLPRQGLVSVSSSTPTVVRSAHGETGTTFEQTVGIQPPADGSMARPVSRSIGLAPRVWPRPARFAHDTAPLTHEQGGIESAS